MNVDDCAPKQGSWEPPCLNGGQCVDGVGRYTCSCPPGFVGEYCEGDLNECLSRPCQSPGTFDCVQLVNDYKCRCRLGYTGKSILAARRDTASPCLFALFVPGMLFRSTIFFSPGRHCESMVDLCLSKPCHNGGVCSMNMSSAHGYICSCPPVSVFNVDLFLPSRDNLPSVDFSSSPEQNLRSFLSTSRC